MKQAFLPVPIFWKVGFYYWLNQGGKTIRGAAILAVTVAIVKVLGAIYKIPLLQPAWRWREPPIFQVTYTIYNLLLTLSTAGIPVALSRLISESAATNRPRQVNVLPREPGGVYRCRHFWAWPLCLYSRSSWQTSWGIRKSPLASGSGAGCPFCLHHLRLPRLFTGAFQHVPYRYFANSGGFVQSSSSASPSPGLSPPLGYNTATVSAGAIVGVTIGILALRSPCLCCISGIWIRPFEIRR